MLPCCCAGHAGYFLLSFFGCWWVSMMAAVLTVGWEGFQNSMGCGVCGLLSSFDLYVESKFIRKERRGGEIGATYAGGGQSSQIEIGAEECGANSVKVGPRYSGDRPAAIVGEIIQ
ncbi:hypothetical protein MANES_01G226102v8 [Manihot esculenta]|uniref:Uncharacterized protein n=1 Tax=Manihot esculenta TaxID=3983 RepID=A0ACB7IJJ9_MANES|nr:hypothetical protein MANES_01G226102v8 [Manihot esculenta]